MLADFRYACRKLAAAPGFTAIALLTLALGIGATTAIFSVINTHLIDPLPGEDEAQLIQLNEITRQNQRTGNLSVFHYNQLQPQREIFERMAGLEYDYMSVSDGDFFTMVTGASVTPEFFDFFGVQPLLGRWLTAEERQAGSNDLIVLSHAWWQSRFGGDPTIIGRPIKIQDRAYREATYIVIGVMPPQFQFPMRGGAYWRLRRFEARDLSEPGLPNLVTFARLAPGVSHVQAQQALDAARAVLIRDYAKGLVDPTSRTTQLRPMRDFFVAPGLRRSLWSTVVAVGAVLLIVCANLANLQLARGEERLREMSVRAALGAKRSHLVKQLLAENFLLALLGGGGGLVLALWLRQLAAALLPAGAPVLRPEGIDGAMLAWTLGISIACGIGFGLLPAWRTADNGLSNALKASTTASSSSRRQRLYRDGLVVAQVALALVLLTGAGLLVRSVVRVLQTDPGYEPAGLARITPGFPLNHYRTIEEKSTVSRAVAERLAALPGTEAVGMWANAGSSNRYLEGKAEPIYVTQHDVGVSDMDYLKALGATLKEGRWLEPADNQRGQWAAIVTEALARRCWPGTTALGQRLYHVGPERQHEAGQAYAEVVGVVKDLKIWSLEADQEVAYFSPAGQRDPMAISYLVRTTLDPASLAAGVRQISKEIISGPTQPSIDWMESFLYTSTASRRLLTWLLASLAALGLFLAMLGVFGVLLHSVVRRTREIGIRMALGAESRAVLGMVFGHGMKLVGLGTGIGLVAAFWAVRLMSGMLYGVTPDDPGVFFTLPFVLLLAATAACWLPARRATKVNPMIALRAE